MLGNTNDSLDTSELFSDQFHLQSDPGVALHVTRWGCGVHTYSLFCVCCGGGG